MLIARDGGFTLFEVLVAMVIVGLVSVGALGAVAAASRTADRAAVAIVGSELADERLAFLRTLSAAALADSADGVERDITGMAGWRWSASLVPRGDGLAMLNVRVASARGAAERRLLRPSGGS